MGPRLQLGQARRGGPLLMSALPMGIGRPRTAQRLHHLVGNQTIGREFVPVLAVRMGIPLFNGT